MVWAAGLAFALLLLPAVRAQPVQATQYIDLPQPGDMGNPDSERDWEPLDLGRLDVIVESGGDSWARFFYTTTGRFNTTDPLNPVLFPGLLRYVDLKLPLGDLGPSSGEYLSSLHSSFAAVDDWNGILGGDVNPPEGKRASLIGMTSVNGTFFVTGQAKNELATLSRQFWNGLSMLDGTTPSFSPVSGQGEIWSAGSQGVGEQANPEGNEVVLTRGGANERWLFVANYCGPDAAGGLLVQRITNLSNVDPTERHVVDMFELLADYASPTSGPAPSPRGPLGDEVDRSFYTATAPNKLGNKMRSMHALKVPEGCVNAGKTLLFTLLNHDPVRLNFAAQHLPYPYYYDDPPVPLDTELTKDDGKYDYVAITDITNMVPPLVLPGWAFDDEAAWAAHTTFLRLPPDLPPGWDINKANNPFLVPGMDWSLVPVTEPVFTPPAAPEVHFEQIVGSATVSTVTSHPNGKTVYITTVDPGSNAWPADPTQLDGGWHVPHLYVLDLTAPGVDFTNQADMNLYADQGQAHHVQGFGFNKVILSDFSPPGQPGTEFGATNVAATLTGFPTGPGSEGTTYPGENWSETTGHTRIFTLHNDAFMANKDRLYVGTDGRQVDLTEPNASNWLGAAGAVFSISIEDPTNPTWLRTLTIPQDFMGQPNHISQVNGLAVVPNQAAWTLPMARNVLVVTSRDTKKNIQSSVTTARNRLILIQDPE